MIETVDKCDYFIQLGNEMMDKEQNFDKAFLCFENAKFYCADKNKLSELEEKLEELRNVYHAKVVNVSIVILSYNNLKMTRECVQSIQDTNIDDSYEIVVVDNDSTDGSVEWLKNLKAEQAKGMKIQLNEGNEGFPKGCNQGIYLAEPENDILLLNNDTVVMPDAIFWLRMGLYENRKVGATGSVSNYKKQDQSIMQDEDAKTCRLAIDTKEKQNVYNRYPYEKRLQLVGYAMLLKRQVLEEIGYLDEKFSPGNFEDNDLTWRMLLAGYDSLLCYNSYIFHYGSTNFKKNRNEYNALITKNYNYFMTKCGFDVDYYYGIREDVIGFIKQQKEDTFCVLDIGCGCGGTLARIKGQYPNAEILGIEKNKEAAEIGKRLIPLQCLDVEEQNALDKIEQRYDYILLGNVLEQLFDTKDFLQRIRTLLKPNGKVIASVANVMNIDTIAELLKGKLDYTLRGCLDEKNKRLFTGKSLIDVFQSTGYHIVDLQYIQKKGQYDRANIEMIHQLRKIMPTETEELFYANQYLLVASAL